MAQPVRYRAMLAAILSTSAMLFAFACSSDENESSVIDGGSGGSSSAGGSSSSEETGGAAGSSSSETGALGSCESNDDCTSNQTCALLTGSAGFACYRTCSTEYACTGESECVVDTYNHSVCSQACDPTASTTECPDTETCRADTTSTTGGYCVIAGTEGEGAPCSSLELTCAPGLECVHPAYPFFGVPRCAPACSVSAAEGEEGSCSVGTCQQIADDRGGCVVSCDPFADDTCTGDLSCEASITIVMLDESTGQGEASGQCVLAGDKSEGEACTGGDCAAGLACGPIVNEYGTSLYACAVPCDADNPCTSGTCAGLGLYASGQEDYGTCQDSCTNVGGDCSDGTWCAPSTTTLGLGVCAVPGTVTEDGACTASTQCAKGLMCDNSAMVCRPFCDPMGSDCASTETCVTVEWRVYGICTAS